uniref:Fibrinogen C-terminal domain-containing protein n=1 Tax=Amphimedon queenslandica TaxID=400682 RepID=A0A1X7T7F2_AMPQE
MPTSFQSEAEDFTLTQNTSYEPVVKTDTSTEEAMYSDLHDYSDYQLPKANVKDTKPPQQPVQYTVGKKSFAAIIILLVIIIFLLVAILVLNLISKDAASSNNAVLTNSGNTAINSNISLIQNKLDNLFNELLVIQNRSSLFNSAIQLVSCKDFKAAHPNSPSGYYYINSRNTYCNMGELCGQEGGWTRIASLDMTNSSQNCSSGLEELMTGGIRLFYSQICGKVVGYQKGTTDGVNTNNNDINCVYIDGVSITRGSPRQHVWSYIAGHQSNINGGSTCPCNTGATNTNTVPSFVGENYYCESGTNSDPSLTEVYTGDPLWDGNNCLSVEAPFCNSTGLPWFFRDYGNATITDYIELRVCGDEVWSNEDTPVQLYEIYVK